MYTNYLKLLLILICLFSGIVCDNSTDPSDDTNSGGSGQVYSYSGFFRDLPFVVDTSDTNFKQYAELRAQSGDTNIQMYGYYDVILKDINIDDSWGIHMWIGDCYELLPPGTIITEDTPCDENNLLWENLFFITSTQVYNPAYPSWVYIIYPNIIKFPIYYYANRNYINGQHQITYKEQVDNKKYRLILVHP